MSRRIVACTDLSLDGVMQAPARPDEDWRGQRLFSDGGPFVDSKITERGVVIATYRTK